MADLGHSFDSLVFTTYDPCYDYPARYCRHIPPYWVRTRPDRFMKRMGLVKCNDRLEVTKVKPAYKANLKEPVWIDLVTGAIYRIPERMVITLKSGTNFFEDVPYYDAPVVITERSLVMKDEKESSL